MEMEGADENAPFSLDIYRGNYPIVDVSSLASDKGYVLIASAFMDSKVKFFLRCMFKITTCFIILTRVKLRDLIHCSMKLLL